MSSRIANPTDVMNAIKTKVYLDTSVFIRLFKGTRSLWELFSEQVLERFTYVTSPVVYQELLLAVERSHEQINLEVVEEYVQLLPLDYLDSSDELRNQIRQLRNRVFHSNDVLIIGSVLNSGCRYLLTYDNALIKAAEGLDFTAVTPEKFMSLEQVSP